MNREPEAPEDNLPVRILGMIQQIQQDQQNMLAIFQRLISEFEKLDQRVKKLEAGGSDHE